MAFFCRYAIAIDKMVDIEGVVGIIDPAFVFLKKAKRSLYERNEIYRYEKVVARGAA